MNTMQTEALRAAPELLAPAGNEQSLHAAVQAGADAVYLGVESFNARRSAENFTLETLARACDFAHLRSVSVYLTLNTAVLPNEADDAMEPPVRRFGRASMRSSYRISALHPSSPERCPRPESMFQPR